MIKLIPTIGSRREHKCFSRVKVSLVLEMIFKEWQIHLLAVAVIVALGWKLGLSPTEWCLIVLCIALVLLAEALNLTRVSAPLVVLSETGLNDHLDGILFIDRVSPLKRRMLLKKWSKTDEAGRQGSS